MQKEEQHAVIRFLWASGIRGADSLQLSAQCGDSVLLQQSMHRWIDMFRSGQISGNDEGSGHLSTLMTEGYIH